VSKQLRRQIVPNLISSEGIAIRCRTIPATLGELPGTPFKPADQPQRFLFNLLTAALIPRHALCCRRTETHHNAPHSRTTACLRSRFGECACQCTGSRDTDNSRQWGKRSSVHAQRTYEASAQPTTADDVCRAIEQSAAENALPVEFFARVVWQESRFNAGSSRLRSRPPTTSRMWATGGESFGSPRVPSVAALTSRTQERCIGR
jgi:hypothetical protein